MKKTKVSYEEFLDHCDEDTLAEWVDGDIIMASPASDRHQDLCSFFDSILRIYAETKKIGVIRIAPFQMRLSEVPSGREPGHASPFPLSHSSPEADLSEERIPVSMTVGNEGATRRDRL